MSMRSMIDRLAIGDEKRMFYTNLDEFVKIRGENQNIIFIAAPWSGRSYSAFHEMCIFFRSNPTLRVPVYVHNTDEMIAAEFAPFMNDLWGNGFFVLFEGTQFRGDFPGTDIKQVRLELIRFLSDSVRPVKKQE